MTLRPATCALAVALCSTLSLGLPLGTAHADGPAQQRRPNLTPQSPSTAPLLRKVNLKRGTMIPAFYCAGVSRDQEVEVQVPPFDWGVANDHASPVDGPFAVSLQAGSLNRAPLATHTVRSIAQSGTRIFRNWPGRPSRVRVINVSASNPKLASEFDGAPGCYIPTALAGRITLDPKLLIVRVDDGGRVAERVENDNDLTR